MPRTKKSKKIEKPLWLTYTEEEVKAIILKLAEKGLTAERIGLVLRDQYGIPKVKIYNLKISKVLKEKDKYTDPDIKNLNKKLEKVIAHYKKNKQDKRAERSLIITKSKSKKREDYQKKGKNGGKSD
jgi:small subunit ribosomal protein S15